MNSKPKQVIFSQFKSFLLSILQSTENKDLILRNYEQMLQKLLESKTQQQLDDIQHEFVIAIQNKQFFSIDFEFNNLILGRAKVFYTQTTFETDYNRCYNSKTTLSDFKNKLNPTKPPISHLSETAQSLKQLIKQEGYAELESLFEESLRERIVISITHLPNSAMENFLSQLFATILLSTADSRSILGNYILDLLRIVDFFTKLNRFTEPILLKTLLMKLMDCSQKESGFETSLFELILTHFGSNEFVSQVSRLLAEILLFVFENTSVSFLSKVVWKNSGEMKQLNSWKGKVVECLRSLNSYELDYRVVFGVAHALFFLFNAKRAAVVVLDEKMSPRFDSGRVDSGCNLLAVSECQASPNYIIFNADFSEVGKQFFVELSSVSRNEIDVDERFNSNDNHSTNTQEEIQMVEREFNNLGSDRIMLLPRLNRGWDDLSEVSESWKNWKAVCKEVVDGVIDKREFKFD